MKRALFVLYNYPPAGGSGVQRGLKFVRYIQDFGYAPTVITLPEDLIDERRDESLEREAHDVPVHRVRTLDHWTCHLRSESAKLVLQRLLLLPDQHILWSSAVEEYVSRAFKPGQFDVIFITCPPSSMAFMSGVFGKVLKAPIVLDYRDPAVQARSVYRWPTIFHELVLNRKIKGIAERASAIVVVTRGMKQLFSQWHPAIEDKLHLIFNGYDESDFAALENSSSASHNQQGEPKLRIGFAGLLHSPYRKQMSMSSRLFLTLALQGHKPGIDLSSLSLKPLLDAVSCAVRKRPSTRNDIEISLCGSIAPDNLKYAEDLGLRDMINVHGYLPHLQSLRMLQGVDILYLPMHSTPWTLPGKVFEYFRLGKPILAIAPQGDLPELITEHNAGWTCLPNAPEEGARILAEAIAAKKDGRLIHGAAREDIRQYERRNCTAQLAKVFDSIVKVVSGNE